MWSCYRIWFKTLIQISLTQCRLYQGTVYEVKSLFLGMLSISSLIRLLRDVGCLSHAHASSNYVRMLRHASCHIVVTITDPKIHLSIRSHTQSLYLYHFVVMTTVIITRYSSHFAINLFTLLNLEILTFRFQLSCTLSNNIINIQNILLFLIINFASVLCSIFYHSLNLDTLKHY